jgi:predicted ATP-dependent endonuclease of OLD family
VYIDKIKIRNFRCFGPEETVIEFDKLTALIGANSCGKTAVLHALMKIFGNDNKEIKRSDFHVPKNMDPQEIENNDLYIEVRLSFPELQQEDSELNSIPSFWNYMVIREPGVLPYVRICLKSSWQKSNTPDGDIETEILFIKAPEGREKDSDYEKAKREHLSRIQFAYVPAIRDVSSQLRNISSSILWRILNSIKWEEDFKNKIREKTEEIDKLFDENQGVSLVRKIISDTWKKYHRDYRYTSAHMHFSGGDLDTILRKVEIEFSPTFEPKSYTINELGDGLRSLFYLTLVNSLLEFEDEIRKSKSPFNKEPSTLVLLAIEEPENHICPHLLGRIMDNLRYISSKQNAQVILTSHSASIISRIEPTEIRHLRIKNEDLCSKVSRIILPEQVDEAFKYVKEAVKAYPEIYFSRLVILGEGDSEELIIKKMIEMSGLSADSCAISIVPLGGRFVNHFWRLLQNIGINYITLLDMDIERNTGGWEKLHYIMNQLIQNGYDEKTVLADLSKEEFDNMPNWSYDECSREKIEKLAKHLQQFDVFFSFPLDIDFTMLSTYEEAYKKLIPKKGGPRIPDKITRKADYERYIDNVVKSVLKSDNAAGITYSDNEKELMVWYKYLFLGRGKPNTHFQALIELGDSIKSNVPDVFKNLINRAKELLGNDPYSDISNLGDEKYADTKGTMETCR